MARQSTNTIIFIQATEHDSAGITLLCPTHHSEKTRGVLPLELVHQFNSNPTAQQNGQTSVTRPYFEHIPSPLLGGGLTIKNTPIPLMIRQAPLIEFLPPEDGSKIARINALITSDDGRNLLRIDNNEWIVETGVWDYEWVGQRMTVPDSSGRTSLQIVVYPPELIEIDRIRFNRSGFDVVVTRTAVQVNGATFVDCIASNNRVGLMLG